MRYDINKLAKDMIGKSVTRLEDKRKYRVISFARSRATINSNWTIINIIISPIDGDYGNYVLPMSIFEMFF